MKQESNNPLGATPCSPLPSLPETLSSDGREIWDWAGRLSAWAQRQDRIRELKENLRICGSRCGDCDKWMKSRQCPREKPGEGKRSGYSVGPSCADLKCREYVETSRATQRRAELTRDLESILANAGGMARELAAQDSGNSNDLNG